ncbi:MAG: metallophosphoesterase [Desulfobacteraceae bacterium]|nr:metallophosphoesterase [Desulfobacteraceae bacterium]
MRLAVISDIHSNMEALTAVLEDISKNKIDKTISLGDNIGYGPEPEEVILELEKRSILSVLGNHELAFLDDQYLKTFNPYARKALEINRRLISPHGQAFIESLPPYLVKYDARFVHGVPPDFIGKYIIKLADKALEHIMCDLSQRVSFVGHTHQSRIYMYSNGKLKTKKLRKMTFSLAKTSRYIINTGSVGQPRDGYNEAKYVIWDSEQNTVESRHIAYDCQKASEKIKKAGIPKRYADQLIKASVKTSY